jgi:hypothetical protein
VSYRIVPYCAEYRDGVARLQTEMWSRDIALNNRYLKWKYVQNPWAAPAWVALDGREVVGMRGGIGMPWRHGRANALVLGAADAMVDERHRHNGLFTALTKAMLSSLDSPAPFINLSSYLTSAAGYLKQGWRIAGSWQVAHRLLSPRRVDTFAPGERGRPTPFAVLDIHARDRLPGPITFSRRPRPAAMARLVARLDSSRLRPVRDRQFYSWRYRNPLSEYRVLFLGGAELRGFMALQFPYRSARARLNVVEWEGATAVDKALLLEAAMTWGDFDGLAVWAGSFSPDEQAIFGRLGFDVLEHRTAAPHRFYCPQILVRPGGSGLDRSLSDSTRWQLPGIASDNF